MSDGARRRLTACAALAVVASCGRPDDIGGTGPRIDAVLAPAALTLRVGDTASVYVTLGPATDARVRNRATAHWTSAAAAVVVVDTATRAPERAATVRAVAPGTTTLAVQLAAEGTVVTYALPVAVRAADR